MDNKVTFEELKQRVRKFVAERDWEQFHHPKEIAISLSLEAAELLEHFQWKDNGTITEIKQNKKLMKELSDELADVLVYSIDFANILGIDLTSAIEEKMKKNEEKYPIDKVKGKSHKYTHYKP